MKKRNTEDWKKAKELESTRLLGKIFETHRVKKKFNNTYEMIKINTETYAKKCINSMTVKNKKVVRPKMKGGHQNWHKDKDELKRKGKRKRLEWRGCEFSRINPDENDFDIIVDTSKIRRHIK